MLVGSCICQYIESCWYGEGLSSACVTVLMAFDVFYLNGLRDSATDLLGLILKMSQSGSRHCWIEKGVFLDLLIIPMLSICMLV
jgi:hypothetical protein